MNRISELFKIKYPIIQGGMVWCSGWRLVSAVSNNGGLGLIGSGSMYPDVLREHIKKCKKATTRPFGVNLPLLYPNIEEHINTILEEKVKIVFTSAGNPKKYTQILKDNGITVVHVVANQKFALKCLDAGVDAIVAEGFEAGGHNGIEEITTMCLIPQIKSIFDIPPPISSTKSMTGHTLGAAGAIESIFSILSIVNNISPPTINLNNPDEGCDLDFIPKEARDMKVDVSLNNSFGFGGTNSTLIFKSV